MLVFWKSGHNSILWCPQDRIHQSHHLLYDQVKILRQPYSLAYLLTIYHSDLVHSSTYKMREKLSNFWLLYDHWNWHLQQRLKCWIEALNICKACRTDICTWIAFCLQCRTTCVYIFLDNLHWD